jgi:altronate dehydratase large subunit
MTTFLGYGRDEGRVGVRNHVVVVSTISCANHVVEKIASKTGAIPIVHDTGCLQFGADREQTARTIHGVGMSPNVGAVLYVGLGCEQTPTAEIARTTTGKAVHHLFIQEAGGSRQTIEKGARMVEEMQAETVGQQRVPFDVSRLTVSVKCGGSDYTTAIASNPAVGVAADLLVAAGGTVLLTETPGLPGSEHILARRAVNREVAARIYEIVEAYRTEIKTHFNRSPHEGNPSPGNVEGGITTLVEKSYGTIMKGGHSPVQGVVSFAEDVAGKKGLWIMDTPGHDVFSVSGPAAGGCNICWFTTGRGSPIGNAVMPVIKICGNSDTFRWMEEDMDVNAGTIMTGERTVEEAGREIFDLTIQVASGKLTKAEELQHWEFAIPRIGSTL